MQIAEFKCFVDVCCTAANVSETEIVKTIRKRLKEANICVTDDAPGRVGNAGTGTIYRFKLRENETWQYMDHQ